MIARGHGVCPRAAGISGQDGFDTHVRTNVAFLSSPSTRLSLVSPCPSQRISCMPTRVIVWSTASPHVPRHWSLSLLKSGEEIICSQSRRTLQPRSVAYVFSNDPTHALSSIHQTVVMSGMPWGSHASHNKLRHVACRFSACDLLVALIRSSYMLCARTPVPKSVGQHSTTRTHSLVLVCIMSRGLGAHNADLMTTCPRTANINPLTCICACHITRGTGGD